MPYQVSMFQSDSTDGLDQMLSDFLKDGSVKVINVSHSSCWDAEHKYISYSVAVAYEYAEEGDKNYGYKRKN